MSVGKTFIITILIFSYIYQFFSNQEKNEWLNAGKERIRVEDAEWEWEFEFKW